VTDIIHHETQRVDRKHTLHSYLVDLGEEIDIQQIMEYQWKIKSSLLLKPPHPKTRYFEVGIREVREDGTSRIDDLEIYPVTVKKKPDLRIWGFRIRQGDWVITGKIYTKGETTEIQWIYTDDFHLFAITHVQEDLDRMIEQVISKIDEIAQSIRSGYRIFSQAENQQLQRDAFRSMLEHHGGIAVNKTAILKQPQFQITADLGDGDRKQMQNEILRDFVSLGERLDSFAASNSLIAKIQIPESSDILHQLTKIEELRDLGWLFD
jgi:hypothetical protein